MTDEELQAVIAAFTEAANKIQARVQEIADVFTQAFNDFAAAMQPTIEQCIDATYPVYRAMFDQYIAEGAIYGATHEGMIRWLEERAAAAGVEANAQYLRDRQWAIEDMQRILRAKG